MEIFDEMEHERRANARRLSTTRNLIAGGVGGMFAWLTSYPFDTVKTRLQAMSSTNHHRTLYTGPLDCLQKMVRREGVRSLFQGVTSPLLISIPSTAVLFYSLALGKRLQLDDLGKEPTLIQYMNAGVFCGFTVSIVSCPAERVKCLMQTQLKEQTTAKRGPWLIIKTIYQQEGFRGFYRGIFPQWGLNMIGLGAWYIAYEGLLKSMRPRDSTRNDVTMTSICFSAAASGIVLWALCFPFDVMKTRYQIAPVGKYPGSRYVLREILSTEGLKGLYHGYTSALLRAPVFNVALLLGYEFSLKSMMTLFPID